MWPLAIRRCTRWAGGQASLSVGSGGGSAVDRLCDPFGEHDRRQVDCHGRNYRDD